MGVQPILRYETLIERDENLNSLTAKKLLSNYVVSWTVVSQHPNEKISQGKEAN